MKNKLALIAPLCGLLLCAFAIKSRPVYVVFIGDSITHGSKFPDQAPPVYAGKYLDREYRPGGVQISNQGVSGRTTYEFLPGTPLFRKVRAVADSFYRDTNGILVFSIMIGTNDSAIKGPKGAPVSPEKYRENLKLIMDSLLLAYPACKIVINHPTWYSGNTHNTSLYMKEGQQRVLTYFPQIDTLVHIYKKINPHHVFKGDTRAYQYFEENYLTDFKPQTGADGVFYLHPNTKGDSVLGTFWAKAIIKVIK